MYKSVNTAQFILSIFKLETLNKSVSVSLHLRSCDKSVDMFNTECDQCLKYEGEGERGHEPS